jgi:hypothetical protein
VPTNLRCAATDGSTMSPAQGLLTGAVGSAGRRTIGDLHVCFIAHSGRCGVRRLIGPERVDSGKLHVQSSCCVCFDCSLPGRKRELLVAVHDHSLHVGCSLV